MIVRVGGQALVQEMPQVVTGTTSQEVVKQVIGFGRVALPISVGAGILNSSFWTKAATTVAVGTTLADRLKPLIGLVQDLALPVGICVATWGIIEIMLQNPAGGKKIKSSIIGFVGIFIVPFVFYSIRDALHTGVI